MKKIVFTLCSNNYLAQAKTLADSVRRFNPDVRFVIGLVDKSHPEIDYTGFSSIEILPFDKIGFDFSEMIENYNIVEFNTAVKPFYIDHFFRNAPEQDLRVCYLDPDIEVFDSFQTLFQFLNEYNFLVTPHIISAKPEISNYEQRFLNVGIFNLGFLALRQNEETTKFILWWKERLKTLCRIDLPKGLFVDQLWVNYLPALFENVFIIKDPGYNMAYWNFHERELTLINNRYFVNKKCPLIFFHFSSYSPLEPDKISRYYKLTFSERSDVTEIFSSYRQKLIANQYESFSRVSRLMSFKKNHPVADRTGSKNSVRMKIAISLKSRINKFFKKYLGV